jgi:hypothetical protein
LFWSLAAILCSVAVGSESQIAGRYILQTANGKNLPAVVAENKETGYQLEVTSGWMELGVDQTFAWRTAYRITENGTARTNESGGLGTYTLDRSTLSLTPESSSARLEGTLKGRILELRADVKLVYQRKDGNPPEQSAPK